MSGALVVFLDEGSVGSEADLLPLRQAVLDSGGRYCGYEHSTPADIGKRIGDASVVITNKCALGADCLSARSDAPLKLILVAATGYNIIDTQACAKAGIALSNVKGYASESVAQHALALILALSTRLRANHSHCRDGRWTRSHHFCLFDDVPVELAGLDAAIVGHGATGNALARLLKAISVRVHLAGRPGADKQPGRTPLRDLLPKVDIVSLHCPLTPANYHLIGAKELKLMRPGALLINTARGGLIDECALAQALSGCTIGGAGLDVLETEPPPPDSVLLNCPDERLILTPHIAWASREGRARLVSGLVKNYQNFIRAGLSNVCLSPSPPSPPSPDQLE
ncbi:MAG: glycerate dehydrogenase [Proteobacteria bacterium]|nr:glycerate dehydrogenase [Pseudomonadota bacterium]